MSQNLTELSLDSLVNVTGGAACCAKGGCPQKPAKKNVAQNGGTGYVDHTYGFGNVVGGGRYSYAAPNGYAGRAASAHGDSVKIHDPSGALPL